MNDQDLRPYQQDDVRFLSLLGAAACFNEQRTGKTPVAIRTCVHKQCTKVLIICPTSVIYQWVAEYTRWCGDPCRAAVGTTRQRRTQIEQWTHGLCISYDAVRASANKKGGDLDLLLRAGFDGLILDEAHRIRHHRTATAKAIFKLAGVPKFKLALTGTPVKNFGHELWGILHFLYPKTFRSYWNFVNSNFEIAVAYGQGRTFRKIGEPTAAGLKQIQEILSRIATNRKRKDIMPWLPDKEYITITLPPSKEQRRYLDELAQYWETEHVNTIGVLDRLIRYRQICLSPAILDLPGGSPKTDWLIQYLTDYPDRVCLVFSKFTSYIRRLAGDLATAGIKSVASIIGDTPASDRAAICQRLQAGTLSTLLLNIDAGKEGLTLDRADTIIFMDRFPPIGDLQQAEDRFVATTEVGADKDHLIYFLELEGTYDQVISQMITERASETDVINNFKNYRKEKHT